MEHIEHNLSRYRALTPPNETIRNIVSRVIFEYTGRRVATHNIRFSNGVVFLSTTPAVKNNIFLQRGAILHAVEDGLGKHLVTNIR